MHQQNKNRKFGREKGQRKAFLKSLCRNLILRRKMTTTLARAKEIRPLVEKMVTRGKNPTVANRRMLISQLGGVQDAARVIKVAGDYQSRPGGYLRIVKMGPRKGDAAQMAVIEFV